MEGTPEEHWIVIDPQGYFKIEKNKGELNTESFKFDIHNPELESKKETKSFDMLVCKKCCGDVVCLDDGQPANTDCKCGSEKRNIDGVCIRLLENGRKRSSIPGVFRCLAKNRFRHLAARRGHFCLLVFDNCCQKIFGHRKKFNF